VAPAESFTLYHYPGCSTCKKALAWLRAGSVNFRAIDLVLSPPTEGELRRYWEASGRPLGAFFNTSGQSYRDGNFKERLPTMSDDQKLAALAADGKLIKRPLLIRARGALLAVAVGFREEEWSGLVR
jgi:arsenate reductase